MRLAVYWVPEAAHPLWQAGCRWLGRNAETGETSPPPSVPGFDMSEVVSEASRYGFHATLKAPFTPAPDQHGLLDALAELASRTPRFALPLQVTRLNGFVAIREAEIGPSLTDLAASCVTELDRFRAPLSDAELTRRRRSPLTSTQDALLLRWGYPYVLEEWRFHLTLSSRLDAAAKSRLLPEAQAWFAPALAEPVPFTELALFEEPAGGSPFRLVRRFPFSLP